MAQEKKVQLLTFHLL